MKKMIFLLAIFAITRIADAQIYLAKKGEVSFFSHTEVSDIEATDTLVKPVMNTNTGDVIVQVQINGFRFPKKLMEEHFNENYMESDKIPKASFTGKVNEKVDYAKDGTTKVTVSGKMDMHGVKKDVTLDGTITVKGTELIIESKFMVHLADYNIKIPSVVSKDLAENVEVKLKSTLVPYKK